VVELNDPLTRCLCPPVTQGLVHRIQVVGQSKSFVCIHWPTALPAHATTIPVDQAEQVSINDKGCLLGALATIHVLRHTEKGIITTESRLQDDVTSSDIGYYYLIATSFKLAS